MAKKIISLTDISKKFKDREVFQQLSLAIYEGQKVGIVAPNGTGKSSLLNIISGISKPDEGTVVLYENKTYKSYKDTLFIKKSLCVLPFVDHLDPDFCGIDYLKIYKKAWDSNISVEDTINLFLLNSFSRKKIRSYSYGMKQKLCLALVYISDASIFVLDEYTNGLDTEYRNHISTILTNLSQKTIITVSHSLLDLQTLCDTVYFLKNKGIYCEFPNDFDTKTLYIKSTSDSTVKPPYLNWSNEKIYKMDPSLIWEFWDKKINFSIDYLTLEDCYHSVYFEK